MIRRACITYASGWRPDAFDHLFALGAWVFVIGLACKLTGLGWTGVQHRLADIGAVPFMALSLFKVTHRGIQEQSRHLTNLEWTKLNITLGKHWQKMIFWALGLAVGYEAVIGVLCILVRQRWFNVLAVGPFDWVDLGCYGAGAVYALLVRHLWVREQQRVLAQIALRPVKE